MITCSGNALIPYSGGRCTSGQHQNALIDVDDHATDSDEIQQPLFLRVRSVLDPKEKCTNGQFPESDGIDPSDLTDPRPFRGSDDLRRSEEMNMVAQSRASGYSQEHLRHHGRDLLSLCVSGDSSACAKGINAPHHGDGGEKIIPAELFDHHGIGVCS